MQCTVPWLLTPLTVVVGWLRGLCVGARVEGKGCTPYDLMQCSGKSVCLASAAGTKPLWRVWLFVAGMLGGCGMASAPTWGGGGPLRGCCKDASNAQGVGWLWLVGLRVCQVQQERGRWVVCTAGAQGVHWSSLVWPSTWAHWQHLSCRVLHGMVVVGALLCAVCWLGRCPAPPGCTTAWRCLIPHTHTHPAVLSRPVLSCADCWLS